MVWVKFMTWHVFDRWSFSEKSWLCTGASPFQREMERIRILFSPTYSFFFLFFFLFEKLTHLLSLTIQTILEIQQGKLKAHPFTFSHALFLLEPKVQNQSMECLSLSCLFLFISLLAFAGKITSLRLSHFPFLFCWKYLTNKE